MFVGSVVLLVGVSASDSDSGGSSFIPSGHVS